MPVIKCGNRTIECEGIIFDKDGTLIDSFKIWPYLIKNRIRILQKGIGFNNEIATLLEKTMGLGEKGEIIRRSPIVVGTREQTVSAINAILFLYLGIPWDVGLEKINQAFSLCDLEMGLEAQAIPIPGAKEVLHGLAEGGFKIAVATNDDLERTLLLMRYSGLDSYIDVYACRNEVKEGKPAPDLIYLACTRLRLLPNQCIIIGDSLLDIQMGINAGVKFTIGVLTGASTAEEMRNYGGIIISSINNIIAIR